MALAKREVTIERPRLVSELGESIPRTNGRPEHPAYHAYRALQFMFGLSAMVAGSDKFFNLLTDWEQYLSPQLMTLIPLNPSAMVMIMGVIEIALAIGIFAAPRVFAYVLAAWMLGSSINLLLTGVYFDLALRDLGLAVSAFALGRLADQFESRRSQLRPVY